MQQTYVNSLVHLFFFFNRVTFVSVSFYILAEILCKDFQHGDVDLYRFIKFTNVSALSTTVGLARFNNMWVRLSLIYLTGLHSSRCTIPFQTSFSYQQCCHQKPTDLYRSIGPFGHFIQLLTPYRFLMNRDTWKCDWSIYQ